MQTEKAQEVAMPREQLLPRHYDAQFLPGRFFMMDRNKFVPTPETAHERIKIYRCGKRLYTIPLPGVKPKKGYQWSVVGKLRSRDIYVADGIAVI